MKSNIKKICLWVIYAGFGAILLAPLLLDNRFFFPFIFTKVLIFRVAVEVALLFYLILNVVTDEYRPRATWLTVLVAAFTLIAAVSSIFGPDPYNSFWGDIERGEGLLLWLHLVAFLIILSGVVRTKRALMALLDVSVGVAILMSLFGLGQAFGVKSLLATSGDRVDATLGNAAFFGAYLILHLGLVLYLFVTRQGLPAKIYYGGTAILFAALVPATQTRGAVLGLVAGIIAAAGLWIFSAENKRAKRAGAAVILGVMALSAGLYAARGQAWVQRVPGLPRVLSISLKARTAQTRLATWQAAAKGIAERPVLGWGLENFSMVFNKNFPPIVYAAEGSEVWFDRAHNVIFDRAVTTGLPGLALFLALIGYPIYYLLRHYLRDPRTRTAAIIFAGTLVAYFIQDLFIFESVATYIGLFLVFAVLNFEFLPAIRLPERVWNSRYLYVGLAVLYGIAFTPILWKVNLYPAKINMAATVALQSKPDKVDFFEIIERYKKVLDAPHTYGLPEYRLEFIDFVGQQLATVGEVVEEVKPVIAYTDMQVEKQLAESPHEAKNWILAMRNYNYTNSSLPEERDARLQKALSFFPEARRLSPTRPPIYQEAGFSHLYRFREARNRGNQALAEESLRGAEENFRTALDLNPQVFESYSNLIMMHLNAGATEKIRAIVEEMEKNNIKFRTPERLRSLLSLSRNNSNFFWLSFWAEELTRLEPENPQAFIDWALAEAYLGHRERAVEIAELIRKFGGGYAAEADIFISRVRSGYYENQISP